MSDKNSKVPTFLVGPAAKRELKRALVKSTNPAETIDNFQHTRSLHSMFAKAFGTQPQHAVKDGKDNNANVESLDTDSVLSFLGHLGVSRHEIHKRIADALQKQLEDEIRKLNSQEPLLNLLKSCWLYATVLPELRPILWGVLKQLGAQTPLAVLKALAEREKDGTLKHAEIFRPLPPLLKRLVWEADWDDKVMNIDDEKKGEFDDNPEEYVELAKGTLLCQTVQEIIDNYCSNPTLLESASRPFVFSARERRVLTTQRRALASSAASTTTSVTATLAGKLSASSTVASSSDGMLSSGKAVAQLRQLLGDTTGGTASYRPKLLYAILSMLMAKHGTEKKARLTSAHLHCTLVADILLAAGGPLPKSYQHVLTLARVLDEAVRLGNLSDSDLIKIQATLGEIYQPDESDDGEGAGDDGEKDENQKKDDEDAPGASTTKSKLSAKEEQPSTFLKRQLNRIITAGLTAMKDSDPQNLFLNPVTDAIAPGYSKVIKKPICISTMEDKIENSKYNHLAEWEADVKLMFKNCIDYNRGTAGQWFRGEANRQQKVYKDEILPQAKRLYQMELSKRNPDDDKNKRKREEEEKKVPTISPLPAANKKRKKDSHDYTPSMPALASMLLADPFVVRLCLDRILRSLRIDVLKGTSLPAAHTVVPSVLQILHMAQWSADICALRGRRYIVPDAGLVAPKKGKHAQLLVPYESLRRYLPVLMHLLLEAELDKRLVVGGDLNPVAESLHDERPKPPTVSIKKGSPPLQVALSLLESAFVYACLPGNSQEASLSVTFVKFSTALQGIAGNIWEEKPFFLALVEAILRHKTRLNRTTRDTIVSTWMDWLKSPMSEDVDDEDRKESKKKKKLGSMTSHAHEYLLHLLNEWAALGNLLMPRDLLLKLSVDLVQAVDSSEMKKSRKFANQWKAGGEAFEPIKKECQRMLSMLPETHKSQWMEQIGIEEDSEEVDEAKKTDSMEEG